MGAIIIYHVPAWAGLGPARQSASLPPGPVSAQSATSKAFPRPWLGTGRLLLCVANNCALLTSRLCTECELIVCGLENSFRVLCRVIFNDCLKDSGAWLPFITTECCGLPGSQGRVRELVVEVQGHQWQARPAWARAASADTRHRSSNTGQTQKTNITICSDASYCDDERLFGAFCAEFRQKFLNWSSKVRWHRCVILMTDLESKGSCKDIWYFSTQTFIFEGKPGHETAVVEQSCGGQMSSRPGPATAVQPRPSQYEAVCARPCLVSLTSSPL